MADNKVMTGRKRVKTGIIFSNFCAKNYMLVGYSICLQVNSFSLQVNSFPARRILSSADNTNFANNLDPNQARQNVGFDLDPN